MLVIPELRYPVTLFVQLLGIALLQAGYPRLSVSSWKRTEQKSIELAELGKGVGPRSLHNLGLAMDLTGSSAALGSFQRAWVGFGLVAGAEADHLHVELDGPALRRIGVDFRI
jgi:hypothetical protein